MHVNQLPAEIWHTVYSHLDKKDFAKCALVCKDWNRYARYYSNINLQLFLTDAKFEKLSRDLDCYPDLYTNITSLHFHQRLNYTAQRATFKNILDHCTNVQHLSFAANVHPAALKLLCNANNRILPNVQRIHGITWSIDYLAVNFRFRNTITDLYIQDIGSYKVLTEQFGDLIGFTSQFPNLRTLHAEWTNRSASKNPIDLNKLLLANKNLTILHLETVCIKKRYTLNDTRRKTYPPLTRLNISAKSMDITVLQHILPQLNQLETLTLHARKVVSDRSLPKMTAEHIIEHVCKEFPNTENSVVCQYKKTLYTNHKHHLKIY